jgi:hypothetical protein
MEEMIQKILGMAKRMNLDLDVSRDTQRAEHHEHCIGLISRNQRKRKILIHFLWLRPEEDTLCFYAPKESTAAELSERFGLEFEDHNWDGLPENNVALGTKMSRLDLDTPAHTEFLRHIMTAWALHCGRKIRAGRVISAPGGGSAC